MGLHFFVGGRRGRVRDAMGDGDVGCGVLGVWTQGHRAWGGGEGGGRGGRGVKARE